LIDHFTYHLLSQFSIYYIESDDVNRMESILIEYKKEEKKPNLILVSNIFDNVKGYKELFEDE
jgi:hypothetical protein